MDHLVNHHLGVAAKRAHQRQKLEQDDAKREDVGLAGDVMGQPEGLFRRHVSRCAQNFAFDRQRRLTALPFGKPKICDPWISISIDQNVAGFKIAMNNPGVMRVLQRTGEREAHLGCFTWRRTPTG